MTSEAFRDAVAFLRDHPDTYLATLEGDEPWVRAMRLARVDDDGTLWYATWGSSNKVRQIRQHDKVCVIADNDDVLLRIFGAAQIVADPAVKQALWHDSWAEYFTGRDDPNYVLVMVAPYRTEFK